MRNTNTNTITKIYSSMTMAAKPQENLSNESRIAEFKSSNGIIFRAKLIGNIEVDEVRGKTVAENAMAKLKFDIYKRRQHKTRVNISLKWNGFYVHLSEGGQELLHYFLLEQISYVWKDSADERALGIIINEGSVEKQPGALKFYAYKTEKPAIPLIMALKELFMFRTNENLENPVESEELQTNLKTEPVKAAEDLMDLNFNSTRHEATELYSSENICDNFDNRWANFSNNSFSNSIPSTIPNIMPNMSTVVNNHPSWIAYNKPTTANQTHFEMSWPAYTGGESNTSNPFMQHIRNDIPISNPNSIQKYQLQSSSVPILTNIQSSNKQSGNLFSDLIPENYRNFTRNSFNSNENETRKISLFDLKNSQLQNEPKMDFSVLDNANARPAVKQKLVTKSITSPLFQID